MKEIRFIGTSKEDIKNFPTEAKREAGFQLSKVQAGLEPSNWKPMSSVGSGVKEIRIKDGNQYRIMYIAKLRDCIYVLHAFEKKTQKTAQQDIDLAKARLKEIT